MNPIDLGEKFMVEDCYRISMKDYLARAKAKIKEILLTSEMSLLEAPILLSESRTGYGGKRYWFTCPKCNKRLGVLLIHPISKDIGCRKCLNLEYRKRRYKGMIEDI